MVIEMFKQSRSRTNFDYGSGDSFSGSADGQSSSNESLVAQGDRERLFESTMSIYRVSQFDVHFLGMIQDFNQGGSHSRDPDVQLIDKVEESQLEGKVTLVARDEDRVGLTVSKHGIKVLDQKRGEVLQRHPLHTVGQVVYYIDSFFKSNLALKVGQVGRTVYDCYVFQCYNEDQAQNICQSVKDVFDMITTPS